MLQFLGALAQLVQRFFEWLDEQRFKTEGRDLERRDAASKAEKEAADAEKVRDAVRDHIAAEPDRLRDDDGFKRPD